MTFGLTGIAALEAEMRDRLADKNAEIERLREEIRYLRMENARLRDTAGEPPLTSRHGDKDADEIRLAGIPRRRRVGARRLVPVWIASALYCRQRAKDAEEVMIGPERNPEYVEVGQNIAPLLPTPHMRWHNGELQQWFEATSSTTHGVTHSVGKWRPIPQE